MKLLKMLNQWICQNTTKPSVLTLITSKSRVTYPMLEEIGVEVLVETVLVLDGRPPPVDLVCERNLNVEVEPHFVL